MLSANYEVSRSCQRESWPGNLRYLKRRSYSQKTLAREETKTPPRWMLYCRDDQTWAQDPGPVLRPGGHPGLRSWVTLVRHSAWHSSLHLLTGREEYWATYNHRLYAVCCLSPPPYQGAPWAELLAPWVLSHPTRGQLFRLKSRGAGNGELRLQASLLRGCYSALLRRPTPLPILANFGKSSSRGQIVSLEENSIFQ